MPTAVEKAKEKIDRANAQLIALLNSTPDDRLNWSPSPTARTPLQIAVHCAKSMLAMMGWLKSGVFDFSGFEEADKNALESEAGYSTREEALALIATNTKIYFDWLDTLTEAQLSEELSMGPMSFPRSVAITFPARHCEGHSGQLEYIQTIYGDRNWRY